MTNRKTLLPTFQSVPSGLLAASRTATLNLDRGKRFHIINLEISDDGTASGVAGVGATPSWGVIDGTASAAANVAAGPPIVATNGAVLASSAEFDLNNLVGKIRVLINGTVQREMTAFELNRLNVANNHNGLTDYSIKTSGTRGTAGYKVYLALYFAEPWRSSDTEAESNAWNIVGVDSFKIEIDLQPGCQNPQLAGTYEWDLPVRQDIGHITKWKRQSLSAGGSTQDFTDVSLLANRQKQDFLTVISLFPSLEAVPKFVGKLKFTVDGIDLQDLLNWNQNNVILLQRGMSPDTGAAPRFDLALDYNNPVNAAYPIFTAGSVNLHLEYFNGTAPAAAAGTVIAIIQVTGAPE